MKDLHSFYKDKVVIVTGSSRGLGKEMARKILEFGGKVVLTARNADQLQAAAKEFESYSASILTHAGDVVNFESNKLLVQKTIDRFGRLDVLINNAALSSHGDAADLKPEVAKQVIDINIYGSLFPVMAALSELKKTAGSILFISSVAGFYGIPGYSTYSLSKKSLQSLAQSLHIELKSTGIFVGIAYPGFIENEQQKKILRPDGQLEDIPVRSKKFLASRDLMALHLLRQIMNKKQAKTYSLLGHITQIVSTFFPFVAHKIFSLNYWKGKSE